MIPSIDKNEFFRQVTTRICSSLDIEKSLENCYQFLQKYIPITQMFLSLFEPATYSIHVIATAPKFDDSTPYDRFVIPEEVRRTFVDAWKRQTEAVIINRPESEVVTKVLKKFIPIDNISMLILPIKLDGERLGSLGIYAEGINQYSDIHKNLLSILNEPFAIAMSNALKHQSLIKSKDTLEDDNQYLHQELLRMSGDKIIGIETGLKNVMTMVRQVGHLDCPVLLMGETGVGKEVIANAIHYSSPRINGPFIKVNCGAIPESLIDSELFGHEAGAFTNALKQKRGRFERAHKGTIFLDEIGDLPKHAQVRLLRVIQSGELERLGGTSSVNVDTRIISATHRNLEEMVKSDLFREDLLFRLNVFPIIIPPLRQRKEDLSALIHYFLEKKAREMKLHKIPNLQHDTINRLNAYHFPGNVRELENMVERALILSQGESKENELTLDQVVSMHHRDESCIISEDGSHLPTLDEIIRIYINHVLEKVNGKIGGTDGAAKILDLKPSTLRSKMIKLGILPPPKTR